MNLEEFGPDAKDEMSPSEYIQYCLERFREYRILSMDPTINSQAAKLYGEKAMDYYERAQAAMDEIEPDMTDHLSDADKALPNKSLADQEAELNNKNTNEMFTKQSRQYDQWADDNDKLKANKAKKDAELSDEDKAMIKKYEDDKEEQENSETNKIDAAMYRESIDLERWAKLAGINENDNDYLEGHDEVWEGHIGGLGKEDHPQGFAEMRDIILDKYPDEWGTTYRMFVDYDDITVNRTAVKQAEGGFYDGQNTINFTFQFKDGKVVDYSFDEQNY